MAAGGRRRADSAAVDPLLQRRVADAEPLRGGANGQEGHDVSSQDAAGIGLDDQPHMIARLEMRVTRRRPA